MALIEVSEDEAWALNVARTVKFGDVMLKKKAGKIFQVDEHRTHIRND